MKSKTAWVWKKLLADVLMHRPHPNTGEDNELLSGCKMTKGIERDASDSASSTTITTEEDASETDVKKLDTLEREENRVLKGKPMADDPTKWSEQYSKLICGLISKLLLGSERHEFED